MMNQDVPSVLVGSYLFGWLADWTYWIAVGWEWSTSKGQTIDHSAPVIMGWFPALFWPLHLGSEIWKMIL